MRVAFLHIPKTAGQSIHSSLADLFEPAQICPARTNQALFGYSVRELAKFSLFSGHLDWSIIKSTGRFDFVFTVLREPKDRILSFYFFLRKEAQRLRDSGAEIGLGMQAALNLSPREYFTGGDPVIRKFLDNHYNNFYAYYFATGNYSGYTQLSAKLPPSSPALRDFALSGLSTLDGIYTTSSLARLEQDLSRLTGATVKPFGEINKNDQLAPSLREDKLTELSGDWDWKQTIDSFTVSDNEIFQRYI